MANLLRALGVLAVAAALTACGRTDLERTATGAVLGGATAAVLDENVGQGALIGGAVGAVSCSVAPGAPNCY